RDWERDRKRLPPLAALGSLRRLRASPVFGQCACLQNRAHVALTDTDRAVLSAADHWLTLLHRLGELGLGEARVLASGLQRGSNRRTRILDGADGPRRDAGQALQ